MKTVVRNQTFNGTVQAQRKRKMEKRGIKKLYEKSKKNNLEQIQNENSIMQGLITDF